MSLIEEKNLQVIVFSGKQDEWKFWEVKFLTQVGCKGFKEILLGRIQRSLISLSQMRRKNMKFVN